jgi:hypothetical protein
MGKGELDSAEAEVSFMMIHLLMTNLIKSAAGIIGGVLLILGCQAVTVIQIYSQKAVAVNGYLVDLSGAPIKNGLITPFYDPPLSGNGATEVFRTFDDGLFGVEIPWRLGRRIMLLMEERPLHGYYPIDLATVSRLTNHRFFKGVVIKEYVKLKELGRVDEFVRYGQVFVDLRNSLPSVQQKMLDHDVYVRIKTIDDRVTVCDKSFRSAYSKRLEKLVFNLPEGSWNLELYDTATGNTVLPPTTVVVSKLHSVELSLVKH